MNPHSAKALRGMEQVDSEQTQEGEDDDNLALN